MSTRDTFGVLVSTITGEIYRLAFRKHKDGDFLVELSEVDENSEPLRRIGLSKIDREGIMQVIRMLCELDGRANRYIIDIKESDDA